jgi:transcriptional regulator with XRE-family HTH domain
MTVAKKRAQDARTNSPLVRRVLEEMARRRRDEAKRIGARIATLRDRSHLTQEAAALRLKVGVRTYQTWEAGDATPRWHNYEKVAKLYGVKVEDLLGSSPLDELGASNGTRSQHDPLMAIKESLTDIIERLERLERRPRDEDA